MPSFNCDNCGDVFTKAKMQQHMMRCRPRFVSCIDCSKNFYSGAELQPHTTCMSEEQKYYGAYAKKPQAQGKQNGATPQKPNAGTPKPAAADDKKRKRDTSSSSSDTSSSSSESDAKKSTTKDAKKAKAAPVPSTSSSSSSSSSSSDEAQKKKKADDKKTTTSTTAKKVEDKKTAATTPKATPAKVVVPAKKASSSSSSTSSSDSSDSDSQKKNTKNDVDKKLSATVKATTAVAKQNGNSKKLEKVPSKYFTVNYKELYSDVFDETKGKLSHEAFEKKVIERLRKDFEANIQKAAMSGLTSNSTSSSDDDDSSSDSGSKKKETKYKYEIVEKGGFLSQKK